MLRTVKVTPILTYTASDGRKYHEKAVLSVAFDGGGETPVCLVDVEPMFYDNRKDHGGELYEAIINGKTVIVEMNISFRLEVK